MSTDYDDFVTVTKLEIDTDAVRQAGTSLGEVDQILSQARTHLESLWREVEDSYNSLTWEFDLTGAGGDTGLNVAGAFSHLQAEVDDLALGPGSRLDKTRVRGETHGQSLGQVAAEYAGAEEGARADIDKAFKDGARAGRAIPDLLAGLFTNKSMREGLEGFVESYKHGKTTEHFLDNARRVLLGDYVNGQMDKAKVGMQIAKIAVQAFKGKVELSREEIALLYGFISSTPKNKNLWFAVVFAQNGFPISTGALAALKKKMGKDYGVNITRTTNWNRDDHDNNSVDRSYESTNSMQGLFAGIEAQYPHAEEPGKVTVDVLEHEDGTQSAVVYIPGTQSWDIDPEDAFDLEANLLSIAGEPTPVDEAVKMALEDAGVGPDDPILLAGHSQGGIVAQNLVSEDDLAENYNVKGILAVGAPAGIVDHEKMDLKGRRERKFPSDVQVLHVGHEQDSVPKLDAAARPQNENVTSVDIDLEKASQLESREGFDSHKMESYVETAQMFDERPHAAVEEWRDSMADVLGDENSVSTKYSYRVEKYPVDEKLPDLKKREDAHPHPNALAPSMC